MRQLGDTLVWAGLILVVGGVVYFTPRLAHYMAMKQEKLDRAARTRELVLNQPASHIPSPIESR